MKSKTMIGSISSLFSFAIAIAWIFHVDATIGRAGNWPQLMGINRSGHATADERKPAALPGESTKPLWDIVCGEGYAGVAVADNQVALFDRMGASERLRLLAAESGKTIWTCSLNASYRGSMNPDNGPRCVPTILQDRIIVYGAAGDLSCVGRVDGKVKWTRNLRKEYQADDGYFGAGNTPLVVGNLAIVNVGGRKQGGVVAVDIQNGKPAWAVTSVDACYASPILLAGEPTTVLVPTQLASLGIDPSNGKTRFQVPFGQRGASAVAATPIQLPNGNVFLTASYGTGACLFKPEANSAEIIYREQDEPVLSSQYATPIAVNGLIVGSDGREDVQDSGVFKGIDPETRKLLWETRSIGIAHPIAIQNRLVIVEISGQVTLADVTAQEFRNLSTYRLPPGSYRPLPAYSNGRLFVRGQVGSSGRLFAIALASD